MISDTTKMEELIEQIVAEGTREVLEQELVQDFTNSNYRPTLVHYTHQLGTVKEMIEYHYPSDSASWLQVKNTERRLLNGL